MDTRTLPRLTYSNVVATIALVVALTSGGAWAAGTVLEGRLLRNGSVSWAKLAGGSVTGTKVRDGSLAAADLSPGARESLRGKQGPPGADGAPGAAGPTGPKGDPGEESAATWAQDLPSGALLRGAYAMGVNGELAGANLLGMRDAVSYAGRRMPTSMTPYLVPEGAAHGAIPECPGTAAAPDAAPGALCIYVGWSVGVESVGIVDPTNYLANRQYNIDGTPNLMNEGSPVWGSGGDTTGPFGAQIYANPAATNTHELTGTWAARAAS